MKVNELLMNIKNKDFKLERGLQIKTYLPMEAKKAIAQGIIYDCTSEENGVVKVDSVQRYMSYVRYMITSHTDLEYTDDNYDALCSTEYGDITLLNAIMDCFDSDAKECLRILNLMTDDLIHDNSIESTVGKLIYNINGAIGTFIEEMRNKFRNLDLNDMVPEGTDISQLADILKIVDK